MLIFVRGDVKLTDAIAAEQLMQDLEAAMEVVMHTTQASYSLSNHYPKAILQCNREHMIGALMNLVNNGVQAAGQGAHLTITVTEIKGLNPQGVDEQPWIEMTIADNGKGVSEQLLANLAEPFFTTKSQGTGLGLAVVRAVTQAHHGDFELLSPTGEGCKAIIRLPVIEVLSTAKKPSFERS